MIERLLDTEGFPARWDCGTAWTPELGWLHILSDVAIWGSYTAIPIILAVFVLRRRDMPFPRIFWLFIAFIFFCGTGHLIEAVIFWEPVYRLSGIVKVGTALVSMATAAAMVPAIPVALAFRSPEELEREVDRRTRSLQESEARQRVMMGELDHRVKNNIAAILSLADQTIEASDDIEQFRDAFMGRLAALTRTHEALSAARWCGAEVRSIVSLTLEPYNAGEGAPVVFGGPDVRLDSRASSSLAMAVHELATNSVKYGSLSQSGGEIELAWVVDDAGLVLTWVERGGPAVTAPTSSGFGTTLIHGVIEHNLEGDVDIDYAPEGLRCVIRIPHAHLNPDFTESAE